MSRHGVEMPAIELPERDFTVSRGVLAAEGLDFEIQFSEEVLAANPRHVESLMFLGSAYTARGEFVRGLEIDLRLLRLRPGDPIVHYNLACSHSLLEQADAAVDALERAIDLGYQDAEHMEQDEDLANIRQTPGYQRLLHDLKSAQATLQR